jgi:hypothetical protein
MFLKIVLSVLFLLLITFFAIRYSKSTKEAAELTHDYIERGIRLNKESRDMIKHSKDLVKEREKMADFDDQ